MFRQKKKASKLGARHKKDSSGGKISIKRSLSENAREERGGGDSLYRQRRQVWKGNAGGSGNAAHENVLS